MSETPQPSSPTESPHDSPRDSPVPGAVAQKKKAPASKKITAEALERRRVGRLKAAETMAAKIKKSGIEKRDNKVKYSVFENVAVINQKNYFTDYLKKDDQVYILRERKVLRQSLIGKGKQGTSTPALDEDEDIDDDEDQDGEGGSDDKAGQKVIVIHPGSKNIRLGFGSDVYPKSFPFVLAIPGAATPESYEKTEEEIERYEDTKRSLQRDFKERMKYYKRRIIPNSSDIAANFNKKVQGETIPEHNDSRKFEFIKPTESTKYFVGEDALKVASKNFKLRYPLIANGRFNEREYRSFQEITGDIQLFLSETLKTHFDVQNVKQFKATLILPDLYDRIYVETFIELLLNMGFQGVAVIQESLAATYGAGVSNACVIDIGAQTTKIGCVDEGMIIPNSRAVVNYGGDDITRYFYKLLKESHFPIDMDENVPFEWKEMEELKEKFITFQDANITVQLYNFMKRYSDRLSEKYEFKVFDEVILAPMALFFPTLFGKPSGWPQKRLTEKESVDIFTGEPNNSKSATQKNIHEGILFSDMADFDILKELINTASLEDGMDSDYPTIGALDKVIIQSITNACRSDDFTKSKAYFSNLLLVGGSSKIEALDFILTDRINIWRPKILALTQLPDFLKQLETITTSFEKKHEMSKVQSEEELQPLKEKLFEILETELTKFMENVNASLVPVEVLPAPREIDPSILTWKGASIYSRLKLVDELWITEKDWDLLGSRVLQHKTLWTY